MRLKNELQFKSVVYDVGNYGSLKVEVHATYDVDHEGLRYTVNKLDIDSVFADEHLDPNVNIIDEIGEDNLSDLLDTAYEKLSDEMDNVNEDGGGN